MTWFRYHTEALDDPKVQRLSPEVFRGWVNILCLAKRHDGDLPPLPDIAFALRIDEQEASQLVEILVENGLLDKSETGLQPHNWNGRQYKSDVSTERVQRYRKRHRNVSETPPETDTDTEPEQKERRAREARSALEFPEFWTLYPHKVGKAAAQKAFQKAGHRTDLQTILDGVRRYIETKPPDRPWCNPATWLNQDRWLDEPGRVTNGNGLQRAIDDLGAWADASDARASGESRAADFGLLPTPER